MQNSVPGAKIVELVQADAGVGIQLIGSELHTTGVMEMIA